MKDLLFSIMAVSLCAGGIGMLAPEGKLKKQIAFLSALVLCASLFSPILKLFGREILFDLTLPDVPTQGETEGEQAILSLAVERICRDLEADVKGRFAVTEASLTLIYDDTDLTAVTITSGHLRGTGEVEKAAAYLSDLLRCPVTCESLSKENDHGVS